jgi:hypothetical protein
VAQFNLLIPVQFKSDIDARLYRLGCSFSGISSNSRSFRYLIGSASGHAASAFTYCLFAKSQRWRPITRKPEKWQTDCIDIK